MHVGKKKVTTKKTLKNHVILSTALSPPSSSNKTAVSKFIFVIFIFAFVLKTCIRGALFYGLFRICLFYRLGSTNEGIIYVCVIEIFSICLVTYFNFVIAVVILSLLVVILF